MSSAVASPSLRDEGRNTWRCKKEDRKLLKERLDEKWTRETKAKGQKDHDKP
jgi:hypothetical protein